MRLLLVTSALVGCSFSPPEGGGQFACSAAAPQCPPGTSCIDDRCVVPADASLPPDFQFRQPLQLALVEDGELTDVPVLVTLTPDVFDYEAVRNDGDDIRFTDLAGNPLVYEVEVWDPGGTSILWVKLRRLGPGDESIWLYYGEPDADPPTGGREVWSRYQAVYHLGGGGADSSAGMNDGALTGTETAPGWIDGGRLFDGNDHIEIGPAPPFLRAVPGATLEAWVKPAPLSGDADQVVVAVSAHGAQRSRAQIKLDPLGDVKVVFRTVDTAEPSAPLVDDQPLVPGEWTWVAAVADFRARTVRVFVNGVESAAAITDAFAETTPDTAPDQALIAIDEANIELFDGTLDEVRIAAEALSDRWLAVQKRSMRGELITFGEPEAL